MAFLVVGIGIFIYCAAVVNVALFGFLAVVATMEFASERSKARELVCAECKEKIGHVSSCYWSADSKLQRAYASSDTASLVARAAIQLIDGTEATRVAVNEKIAAAYEALKTRNKAIWKDSGPRTPRKQIQGLSGREFAYSAAGYMVIAGLLVALGATVKHVPGADLAMKQLGI